MRMRVEAREGVLVVYDAATPAEGEEGCSGYIGYWLSKRDETKYIFPAVLQAQGDLAAVLLALERDLGVDLQALADRDDRIEEALNALPGAPNDEIAWEPANLHRAVEIMGFAPGDLSDLNDGGGDQTAALCDPWGCPVSLPPPRNCESPGGLAREAWAVAVECCPPPPQPCCGGGPTGCVCCPGAVASAAEGSDSAPDGMGSVAVVCCGPSGVCDDGDLCTDDDNCAGFGWGWCPWAGPLTCCGVPKNCNDGDSCTYDLCNPNTGSCVHDPRCSDRNCCPSSASPWYFCCNTGEEICCPTNPVYADHCCDSGETCCGAGCCLPTQECCNGACGTKGACCKFDTGSCSEETRLCCEQQGGSYQGDGSTCTPGDLCRPVCENCHAVSADSYECAHFTEDPNEPCSTTQCILNMVNTVSCDSFPHRKGRSKCDTKILTTGTFEIQELRQLVSGSCPTFSPGGYHLWMNLYSGCVPPCNVTPINNRCDTLVCEGTLVQTALRTPGRACGCP